ncbi:LysR family transcriptional regulator [Parasalinivibrio latis]|uniref:LysR family transcriptional regulator n=1 Tax=Parasalinivibrio latis TaxID=2952610 RepID=UPI0030DEE6FE
MAFNTQLLDGMVVFTEVVNSGSFTRAAESMGHSTSFISKEINKLEERLGVRLLNRTTRSLSLTPEGKIYYQQCSQLVLDAQELENALSGHQQSPKGVLKISCPISFGLSQLRPVLSEFTERYPGVVLDLDVNDRKVDVVADGFDVVIRASAALEDSSLISRRILTSATVTLAAPSYLKKYGTPTHPIELVNHKTMSYSNIKNHHLWPYHDKDGNLIEVEVKSQVLTNSSQMEIALCVAGQGIMRMPLFNLNGELERGELVELFPDYVRIPVEVYLVYASRKHMSSKVRCFIDYVVEAIGDL